MPEEEVVFRSTLKHTGIFLFRDFYKFCYDWLVDELNLIVIERKYDEKIAGDSKVVEIDWECIRKITDYFRFKIDIRFRITDMKDVEITKDGAKIKMNHGRINLRVKGILQRDYEGKFEKDAFRKFLRGVYEKWVIPSRIEEFRDKLVEDSDEFLAQTKAFLDLEGKSRGSIKYRE